MNEIKLLFRNLFLFFLKKDVDPKQLKTIIIDSFKDIKKDEYTVIKSEKENINMGNKFMNSSFDLDVMLNSSN